MDTTRCIASCAWSRVLRTLASTSIALALCHTSGCGAPHRKPLTDPAPEARFEEVTAQQRSMVIAVADRLVPQLARAQDDFEAGRRPDPPVVDILALSGGGDYGAFGAGFLNGWGTIKDGAFKRPTFDIVTGVSTGALIAPFAFANTDESYERIETLYCNPKPDWVEQRGLFFFMPSNESLMNIDGLRQAIYKAVNADLVRRIAAEGDRGRVLVIAATNQDLGMQQLFDLGAEAKKLPANGDTKGFCQYMLASSAIPGAFPPVEIGGYLYGDGGATQNVLVRLDLRSPYSIVSAWRKRFPGRKLPKVRYWIIFDNQVQTPPETVQPSWVDLAGRALAISIRYSTLYEIQLVAAEANELNATGLGEAEVRLVAIPNDWRPPVKGDFKKPTMDSLAELGHRLGADPKSWTLLTAPPNTR